jgi:hypothetical protein
VAQIDPEPTYDHRLAERVVVYLQTKDPRLFPFTARFDGQRRRAFVHDLREGLAEITDSGSARKTSATGFVMNDERLRQIVAEWAAAQGGWPRGADPQNPVTALGAVSPEDEGLGAEAGSVGAGGRGAEAAGSGSTTG